jgi:hypothetical protein
MGCALVESDPVAITTTLSFTMPGDDGYLGTVDVIQIRMALTADSLTDYWFNCQIVNDTTILMWAAGVYDSLQTTVIVEPEVPYYFMARGRDNVGNWGLPGNIYQWTPPDVIPPATVNDLYVH